MMDVAKEFIKRSPESVMTILAVGVVALGAIYIIVGSNNSVGTQVGVLMQQVNDLRHEVELVKKDFKDCESQKMSCETRLKVCESRGFVKVK